MAARVTPEIAKLQEIDFAKILSKQRSDQLYPSGDSILEYHAVSKTGTWIRKRGRIVTACKSRINLEEILYLMERASITCVDAYNNRMTVTDMYAVLVDSAVDGHTVVVSNYTALRDYIVYAHLRRLGYKVTRLLDCFSWLLSDCRQRTFPVRVVSPRDFISHEAHHTEEHICIVDESIVVFLLLNISSSVPSVEVFS